MTMTRGEQEPTYEGWTILELMGHRSLAGMVQEVTIAGAGFLRVDVYGERDEQPYRTQFYPPSAVYCITPTTEVSARAAGERAKPRAPAVAELPIGSEPSWHGTPCCGDVPCACDDVPPF